MSIGKFKPAYYTFCDDNVLYDSNYAGFFERQNDIHKRVKEDTPYLESLVLFEDIEVLLDESATEINFYSSDVTPMQKTPRKDIYRFNAVIGDAHYSNDAQKRTSWKVVALNGVISASADKDISNNTDIPQIDMNSTYKKKIIESDPLELYPRDIRMIASDQTPSFSDGTAIQLTPEDLVIYFDESNTEIFNENFDIEVFEVLTGSDSQGAPITKLQKLEFLSSNPQIVNGIMTRERATDNTNISPSAQMATTGNVEYYFDIFTDSSIDEETACRGALEFNKESYYIDLDFDCSTVETGEVFYDIYGNESGEPEVCQ